MGWQREVTGSVWAAGLTHAVHNVWIQSVYPSFLRKGSLDQYFGGESGLFIVLIYGLMAFYIYKRFLGKKGTTQL